MGIGSATSASLVLGNVNLANDAAQVVVAVEASSSSASATAVLQVSVSPPVVFEDGEFVPDGWGVGVTATPSMPPLTIRSPRALSTPSTPASIVN